MCARWAALAAKCCNCTARRGASTEFYDYRAYAPGDRRVMRFFPGSPTHDESFAYLDRVRARTRSCLEELERANKKG